MSFVTKENTQDIYPLSPTQKGMLFHTIYDEKTPVYFEQLAFTIKGPLDVNAFKKAWEHLIFITPAFRTVFKWTKVKAPLQVVLKHFPVDLELINIEKLAKDKQEETIRRFLDKDKATPFDMEEGPLIRLNLFRLNENKHHFIWSYHHIFLDGWCMPMVLKDLYESYMACIKGASLPRPIRRPYKDYIGWTLKQDQEASTKFWKKHLWDLEAPTLLPFDRMPGQSDTTAIGMERLSLSEEMTARLQTLTRKERITLSSLVQSVWSILLSCYGNQEDVVSGSTVSGRPPGLKGVEDMVGLFINTLPVRVRFTKDMTISELLQSVQKFTLAIRDYEYSLLSDVKACSAIPKSQNLFDSIVVFENYPVESFSIGEDSDFGISNIKTVEMTNFPLTLIVSPGTNMNIDLHYYKALFDRGTIQKVLGHMDQALKAIVNDQTIKVSDLDILTKAERREILVGFNDTGAPFPGDKCPYQIFEEQAARTPDNIALTFEDKCMTYRELNERVNQLAHYLRKNGVAPDAKVGLLVERSFEMLVGILGIQKAGGAYIPMDPEYPKARLEYMLKDSRSPVLVTQSALLGGLSQLPENVVVLDKDEREISLESKDNPMPCAMPANLSHLIYTSGSTGLPKGVMIEHRNVTAFLFWALDEFAYDEYEKMIASTSMCFDLSVFEFFLPLITGAQVIILRSSLDLDEFLQENSGTMINTVRSALKHLLASMRSRHSIKAINLAGEPLKLGLVQEAYERIDVDIIRNLYGPTEDTTYSTNFRIPKDIVRQPLIGEPIANTRVYILNKFLNPVPVGIKGEIYLSGADLARGYWEAPEKTEERFIQNLFCPDEYPFLYKTGDIGSWLPDGNIAFHGRVDYQVKIRGNRIEMGEIEARLSRHELISDVAVVDNEDEEGNKYLLAYYVSKEEISTTDLREHIKDELPDYMVPSRFILLDQLPLTPNGKVDRNALPKPDTLRPKVGTEYLAPQNELQESIADVWQKVLGIDKVGINDNFFDLGGDSIISLQVVGKLKKAGYDIRPRHIFEHQTIFDLALVVADTTEIIAEQGPVSGTAPLTPIQRWFFDQQFENNHFFNQSLMFRSNVQIDKVALQKSLQALINHHDALRMRFPDGVSEGSPLGEKIFFRTMDVKDNGALEQAVYSLLSALNIESGPVFGVGLFQKDDECYLVFTAHHLVVDGVSWRILFEDLFAGYSTILNGGKINFPAKTSPYKTWAARLTEVAGFPDMEKEIGYWEEEFDVMIQDLPVDHDKGKNDIASSTAIKVALDETSTEYLLKDANTAFNTDLNDLLMTAILKTLMDWTGHDHVMIDLERHGREDLFEDIDISRTVGWFTTIFPVVFNTDSLDDSGSWIKYVKERLRAVPHKGFNYGMLKYMGRESRVPDRKPQIVFNYLGQVDNIGLKGSYEPVDTIRALAGDPVNCRTHLIDISCRIENSKLLIHVGFSRNRYLDSTMERLSRHIKIEIESVIRHCMEAESVHYTPSDFSLAKISQEQLDVISTANKGIEDIYPLSPMQSGMLFHALYDPDSPIYSERSTLTINGDLNFDALKKAWAYLGISHPLLRTIFKWEGMDEPIQIVKKDQNLGFFIHDFSSYDSSDQDNKVAGFLEQDQKKGFDFTSGPLMRLNILVLGGNRFFIVWCYHHILIDGWCQALVLNDLFTAYTAIARGKSLPTIKRPHYRKYISWLKNRETEMATKYWKETLHDFDSPTLMPTDYRPRNRSGFGIEKHTTLLSREMSTALTNTARRMRITLSTLIQGAWAFLLNRYSLQKDVVFGVTISGRPADIPDSDQMIGLFINSLPVRVNFKGDVTFNQLLEKIQSQSLKIQEYGYSFLPEVKAMSGVSGTAPLFNSLVIFENFPTDYSNMKLDKDIQIMDSSIEEMTNFDLTLFAIPGPRIELTLHYAVDLFRPDTIAKMMGHMPVILEHIINSPEAQLTSIDIVGSQERELLVHGVNRTEVEYDKQKCAFQLFEEQVEKKPDSTALVFRDTKLTYRQLNEKANQLARILRTKGVKRNSIVGILVDRSLEMMVGLLGILKAGGAYLPLDPEYPEERIKYMLENSESCILLTRESVLDKFQRISFNGVMIDIFDDNLYQGDSGNLDIRCSSSDLAYVIYTSGSTGKPKGVMIEHRNVGNFIKGMASIVDFSPEKTIIALTTISFDIFVLETHLAFAKGLKIVIADEREQNNPLLLKDVILTNNVDMLQSTPSRLKLLMSSQEFVDSMKGLTDLMVGGEPFPDNLFKSIKKVFSGKIYNVYGPTETTVWSTVKDLTDLQEIDIGTPIANTQVYVIDHHNRLQPMGVSGELCIGGDGLARGYLKRPGLTAEKFVDNPFVPGQKMYKTGDVARWLPDGNLECMGRMDHQVKIRGNRIELGEIEVHLARFDLIDDIIVMDKSDKDGDKYLAAYYVSDETISPSDFRVFLKDKIPDYMIPSRYVLMESLPLTPNGKVDRKALPDPDHLHSTSDTEYVAPRNELEATLARSWEDALGIEKVGIHNNFFDLGGHSLLVMKALANLKLAYPISVQEFFDFQTVAELAQRVLENMEAASASFSEPDLKAEARIEIAVDIPISDQKEDPKAILLTGVTGYLGAHLLFELLRKTDAHIYCFIRGDDNAHVRERLKSTIDFYFGADSIDNSRITPVLADIARDGFNLNGKMGERLQIEVDTIVHSAADVRYYGAYDQFKNINVLGTKRLVEFGCSGNCRRFHHISTLGIAGNNVPGMSRIVFKEEDYNRNQAFDSVYTRTKFEAEAIVRDVMEDGFNATIHRVGILVGETTTGKFQKAIETNAFYGLLKSIAETGVLPDESDGILEMTPIDSCRKAMVELMLIPETSGRCLHLYNPNFLTYHALSDAFGSLGYNISLLPADKYFEALNDIHQNKQEGDALERLIPYVSGSLTPKTKVIYDNSITTHFLDAKEFKWPELDKGLVCKLIEYCVSAGFIPPPL